MSRAPYFGLAFAFALSIAHVAESGEGLKRDQWRAQFRASREAIVEARQRHRNAIAAYAETRHRRNVRGAPKRASIDELAAAEAAVPVAEAALRDLYERARRAVVPPGWMRVDADPEDPANSGY